MVSKESQKNVHISVLLKESIEGLNISKDSHTIIDSTFGAGGHSLEILKRYPDIHVVAIDQDKNAWDDAKDKFKEFKNRFTFVNGNFRDIKKIVNDLGIKKVDGILFDLGFSSDQLENRGRGFSFLRDEPLLMTMKTNPSKDDLTAMELVNTWGEDSIASVIYGYGEERYARRIAKGIVEAREKKEIKTTFDLVEVIRNSIPNKYTKNQKIHFATKTFQALRIAVNDELNTLEKGLMDGFEILDKKGRMSVISFHSLEDRIVKNFFKNKAKPADKNEEEKAILINKKVIVPSALELKENKRARSAKLRILEKIK